MCQDMKGGGKEKITRRKLKRRIKEENKVKETRFMSLYL
jgi:hypothetical protein